MLTPNMNRPSCPSSTCLQYAVLATYCACALGLLYVVIGCQDTEIPHRSGSWKQIRQADWETRFYDVFFWNGQKGWAVGNNEGSSRSEDLESIIATTYDGGKNWHSQKSGTVFPLRKVQFTTAQIGWIIGDNGVVLSTFDGGENWHFQSTNTVNNLYDLYFLDSDQGWVIGDYGLVLHTLDSGQSWQKMPGDFREHALRGIYFLNPDLGWIVTYEGYIYHTQNGGRNWDRQRPVGYELSSVYFADTQCGWITGNKRTILKTQDGGQSWQYVTEGSNQR
ncbi:MAG: YCF48-related protein, partial [Candidatus Poribacteria bacterium]|nr:YCF48-related protein [Candidatus Poribacteria bacterium]